MKTAISVPDHTATRVDRAARQIGVSRSEFYAKAAERWLNDLEGRDVTARIDSVLAAGNAGDDSGAFVRRAAERLPDPDERW